MTTMVEERRFLRDVRDERYHRRDLKDKGYSDIAEALVHFERGFLRGGS